MTRKHETLQVTQSFHNKITTGIKAVKDKRITFTYLQRLAELINFIEQILRLPLQVIYLALKFSNKLYKILPRITTNPILKVLHQLIDIINNKIDGFHCVQSILENEFFYSHSNGC